MTAELMAAPTIRSAPDGPSLPELMTALPVATLVVAPDNRIVDANVRAETLLRLRLRMQARRHRQESHHNLLSGKSRHQAGTTRHPPRRRQQVLKTPHQAQATVTAIHETHPRHIVVRRSL